MTEATKGGQKDITSILGCEVVYLSTVANLYTYSSRFGTIQAAFFQPIGTASQGPAAVSVSGSTVTISVSSNTSGYLQVWGE